MNLHCDECGQPITEKIGPRIHEKDTGKVWCSISCCLQVDMDEENYSAASNDVFKRDWDRAEEDEAWEDL